MTRTSKTMLSSYLVMVMRVDILFLFLIIEEMLSVFHQREQYFLWVVIYGYIEVGSLLEKAMAPHSSTLAWKIPWMEEPGGLQSMGSQRVGHD